MNDRFKFRVWDKESQKYHNGMEVFDYMRGVVSPDKYVMEQCTGLKDKNGKLVYDGDILRAINSDTINRPDLQIGYIWVDELNCRWIKFKKEELSWNDFCSLIDYDCTLTIEIVGNIHENKELLND